MDRLLEEIDGYCERIGPDYWAEPVNAVTNLAFIIAALVMWQRCRGVAMGRWLAGVLFAIGVGSYLFHTHGQVWSAIADVVPIGVFILLYIFAVNRDVLRLPWLWALGGMLLFLPYAALTIPLWQNVPVFGVSAGYMPVPVLILLYALYLRRGEPQLARGFVLGAALLLLSLVARGLDMEVCDAWPLGTHFLWHLINGVMLGWMIEVYRRHMLR